MEVKNEEFINPQDSLPNQLGTKEKREEMRTMQRYSASQKRKADLAVKENDFSKIPYYGDGICRDERVVERNGQLYRETPIYGINKAKGSNFIRWKIINQFYSRKKK